MANIYDWLEDVEPVSYAPTSPPYMRSSEPTDENLFFGVPMDGIAFLDVNEYDNTNVDVPPTWSPQIDPSLATMVNPPAVTDPDQAVVMVPKEIVDASREILIYLTRIIEIPDSNEGSDDDSDDYSDNNLDEDPDEGMTFTTEELEALEPIDEENPESSAPSIIDGVCVDRSPLSTEIQKVLDFRRVGPRRRSFYLAKTIDGLYYWFRSIRTDRDRRVRELVRDYRRKSRMESIDERTHDVKKLRNGKTIEI
jgi:hypothetical protein